MPDDQQTPSIAIETANSRDAITGVPTSVTAFVGYTASGVIQSPERVQSFADFERNFGGLASDSELSYAVKAFFDNGGTQAFVVRIPKTKLETAPDKPEQYALPGTTELIGDQAKGTGIYPLANAEPFNLLSIPDAIRSVVDQGKTITDPSINTNAIYTAAMNLCLERNAFLLVDSPVEVNDVSTAVAWKSTGLNVHQTNGAAYFPRMVMPDPLNGFKLRAFAPSGAVAGVYARMDAEDGVWKAPAGIDAKLIGVEDFTFAVNDDDNGQLNGIGVNCLRKFAGYGPVVWGARTLLASDTDFKYVPVRRLALYIEESLSNGLSWTAAEPNDEPLWAAIRQEVSRFMQSLFTQGAFMGATASSAYFVECDSTTTSPEDMQNGIVNVAIGFAPTEPAEFVVLNVQVLAAASNSLGV
jgi:phage tail sheath protein FI